MFKLKFFGRKKNDIYPIEKPIHIKLSDRNYERLKICDASLKIWLSEPVENKISEMCSCVDTTASDFIRQILFIHLYGRYDLFGLIERQNDTFRLNQGVRYKISDEALSEEKQNAIRAKHVADIKIWIPTQMKDDLQLLAEKSDKKLSVYAREIIIIHLFGNIPPPNMIDSKPQDDWSEEGEYNEWSDYKLH